MLIGVNKLFLVPNERAVFGFTPNGLLLLIKTPLPLCEGDACLNVLPTRLAVGLDVSTDDGVGVGAGAGAGGGLGRLGAHIKFLLLFQNLFRTCVRIYKKKLINNLVTN